MSNFPNLRIYKKLPRLFVDYPLSAEGDIVLDKAQSNYLANVLRKKMGDDVILFNGVDGAWRCKIGELSRKKIILNCIEQINAQVQSFDLWYGFAPLKTGRLDYMVQKATEMGVRSMQPIITEYTQNRRLKVERMRANIIEAAEQCELLNVPQIQSEIFFEDFLSTWKQQHGSRILVFADEGSVANSPLEALTALKGKAIGLLVGPEGGFSPNERQKLLKQDFCAPISLGPRIMRADTAAVTALALIQSTIGDWSSIVE